MNISIITLILLFTFSAFQQSAHAQGTNGSTSRSEQAREIRINCSREAEVLSAEEAATYVKECVEIAKTNLNWSEEVPPQADEINDQPGSQE